MSQTYKKPFKKSFITKDVISKMTIDTGIVNKLFSMIPSGNYDKISKFISENNMTYNVVNNKGETALHIILDTPESTLDKKTKIKLIYFFLKNGASVDTFTKINKTPLHIASKHNYYDISKLLLKFGASVDAEDGNQMIPLHYSVQGNMIKCKQEKIVGSMIPAAEFDKRIINTSIKKLMDIIGEIFLGNDVTLIDQTFPKIENINYILQHINNFITRSDELFPDKFNAYRQKFNSDVSEIINNTSSTDVQIRDQIDKKIVELKDTVGKELKINYGSILSSTSINIRHHEQNEGEKGWSIHFGSGPDRSLFEPLPINNAKPQLILQDKDNYLIMPEINTQLDIYNDINDVNQQIVSARQKFTTQYDKLNDRINTIKSNLDGALAELYNILYYARAINAGQTTVGHYLNLMTSDVGLIPLPVTGNDLGQIAPPAGYQARIGNLQTPFKYDYAKDQPIYTLANSIMREHIEINVKPGEISVPTDLPTARPHATLRVQPLLRNNRRPTEPQIGRQPDNQIIVHMNGQPTEPMDDNHDYRRWPVNLDFDTTHNVSENIQPIKSLVVVAIKSATMAILQAELVIRPWILGNPINLPGPAANENNRLTIYQVVREYIRTAVSYYIMVPEVNDGLNINIVGNVVIHNVYKNAVQQAVYAYLDIQDNPAAPNAPGFNNFNAAMAYGDVGLAGGVLIAGVVGATGAAIGAVTDVQRNSDRDENYIRNRGRAVSQLVGSIARDLTEFINGQPGPVGGYRINPDVIATAAANAYTLGRRAYDDAGALAGQMPAFEQVVDDIIDNTLNEILIINQDVFDGGINSLPSPYGPNGLDDTDTTRGMGIVGMGAGGAPGAPAESGNNRFNMLHFLYYAHERIMNCMRIINSLSMPFVDHVQKNYYYEIYNTIVPYIACEIQNIEYLFAFMKSQQDMCNIKLSGIKNHATNRFSQDAPLGTVAGIVDGLAYYHEYIQDASDACLTSLSGMYSVVDQAHTELVNMIDPLNGYISLIEKKIGYNMTNQYRIAFGTNNFASFALNDTFNKKLDRVKPLKNMSTQLNVVKTEPQNLVDSILLSPDGYEYYRRPPTLANIIINICQNNGFDAVAEAVGAVVANDAIASINTIFPAMGGGPTGLIAGANIANINAAIVAINGVASGTRTGGAGGTINGAMGGVAEQADILLAVDDAVARGIDPNSVKMVSIVAETVAKANIAGGGITLVQAKAVGLIVSAIFAYQSLYTIVGQLANKNGFATTADLLSAVIPAQAAALAPVSANIDAVVGVGGSAVDDIKAAVSNAAQDIATDAGGVAAANRVAAGTAAAAAAAAAGAGVNAAIIIAAAAAAAGIAPVGASAAASVIAAAGAVGGAAAAGGGDVAAAAAAAVQARTAAIVAAAEGRPANVVMIAGFAAGAVGAVAAGLAATTAALVAIDNGYSNDAIAAAGLAAGTAAANQVAAGAAAGLAANIAANAGHPPNIVVAAGLAAGKAAAGGAAAGIPAQAGAAAATAATIAASDQVNAAGSLAIAAAGAAAGAAAAAGNAPAVAGVAAAAAANAAAAGAGAGAGNIMAAGAAAGVGDAAGIAAAAAAGLAVAAARNAAEGILAAATANIMNAAEQVSVIASAIGSAISIIYTDEIFAGGVNITGITNDGILTDIRTVIQTIANDPRHTRTKETLHQAIDGAALPGGVNRTTKDKIKAAITREIAKGIDPQSYELIGIIAGEAAEESIGSNGITSEKIKGIKLIVSTIFHYNDIQNEPFPNEFPTSIPDITGAGINYTPNLTARIDIDTKNKPKYMYRNKDDGLIIPNTNISYNIDNFRTSIQNKNTQLFEIQNKHFLYLKYNTIVKILNQINNIINTNNIQQRTYTTNNMMKNVSTFIKKIGVNGNRRKTEYALILIGKTIDKMMSSFIKQSINSSATVFTSNLLKHEDLKMINISKFDLNTQKNTQIIVGQEQGFKLNFTEVFEDLLKDFEDAGMAHGLTKDNNVEFDKLFKSTIIMKTNDELEQNDPTKLSKFEHYIFSINYHSGNTKFEKMCFKIDNELVNLLLKKHSNINKKDTVGNTPIYYAINIQHTEIINILLNWDAKLIGTQNNSSQTPLDYAIDLFQVHNNVLFGNEDEDKDIDLSEMLNKKLCASYIKSIEKYIDEQGKYKNNYIKFIETSLPMMIIMYNQYLFSRAQNYHKEWSHEDHIALINLLNVSDDYYKHFSFIELNEDEKKEIISSSRNVHVLKYGLKNKDKEKKEANKKKEMYTKQIKNIRKNINKLEASTDIQDIAYVRELNKKITEFTGKITEIDKQITDLKIDNISNNMNNRISSLSNQFTQLLDNFKNDGMMERYRVPVYTFYESVFENITDIRNNKPSIVVPEKSFYEATDWRTYIKMWDSYIKNGKRLQSIENIHFSLAFTIKNIIKELKSLDVQKDRSRLMEIKKKISLLNKFYKNIFVDLVEDYYTLPPYELQKNYILSEYIDICKHVIHHIITRTFFYTLVKLIYKYAKERSTTQDSKNNRTFLNKTVEAIINDNTSGISLVDLLNSKEYDFELKIIKNVLSIYDGDYDPDKATKNLDEIFDQITNIFLQNNIIEIESESELITYLRDYIYPYYKNAMYTQTINQMLNLFETYNKYILNEARHIEILDILLTKISEYPTG